MGRPGRVRRCGIDAWGIAAFGFLVLMWAGAAWADRKAKQMGHVAKEVR